MYNVCFYIWPLLLEIIETPEIKMNPGKQKITKSPGKLLEFHVLNRVATLIDVETTLCACREYLQLNHNPLLIPITSYWPNHSFTWSTQLLFCLTFCAETFHTIKTSAHLFIFINHNPLLITHIQDDVLEDNDTNKIDLSIRLALTIIAYKPESKRALQMMVCSFSVPNISYSRFF